MKKAFFEYYQPTKEEVSSVWKNCFLVLDTNVLLNLYRYSVSTRDDILATLKKFSSRLWMPFQVGWEYHNNREEVISKTYMLPSKLSRIIKNKKEDLINGFKSDYARNPYLSVDVFVRKLDRIEASLLKFIDDKFKDAPKLAEEDTICNELTAIYDGRVGEDFSEVELRKLYEEGMSRYAAKIPPGYKDDPRKRDKGERHLYGDFIMWKQIILHASKEKKDVVFVSEDLKEDWMRIEDGQKKGPRRELLREFFDKTGGSKILILTQQSFLDFVHSLPEHSVKSSTIKEVKIDNSVIDPAWHEKFLRSLEMWPLFGTEATKTADLFKTGVLPMLDSYSKLSEMTSIPFLERVRKTIAQELCDSQQDSVDKLDMIDLPDVVERNNDKENETEGQDSNDLIDTQ